MVSESQLERVPPSQVAVDDVLFLADVHDSAWGLVTGTTQHLATTRCEADSRLYPVHEHDAYHFACEVYSQENKHLGSRVVCEPVAMTDHGRTYVNSRVGRSIQK